jgi:NRAMP (natural resistance-associated macrophage protein)-like metal ion transporter
VGRVILDGDEAAAIFLLHGSCRDISFFHGHISHYAAAFRQITAIHLNWTVGRNGTVLLTIWLNGGTEMKSDQTGKGGPVSKTTKPAASEKDVKQVVTSPFKAKLLRVLGPGLITGASDDDPSGIATYSQAGAQFGFSITWTLLFTYPLMAAIQEISGRIGRVTGQGIAANLREHYPNIVLQCVVFLVLIANTINIGADLGAMGDAVHLLVGGPTFLYVGLFATLCVTLEVFITYDRYVSVLKWLTLALLAYFGTVMVVQVPWMEAAKGFFIPTLSSKLDFWTVVVAILGTTISPYLFFWQASQEVEDIEAVKERKPLKESPKQGPDALDRIRLDTYIGMAFSNLVSLAIMFTTAATLHAAGKTDIQTSSQAAEALKPVAGEFAFAIFALGIIGTGLLAVPVLAGSAAYALGEARRWPVGLARKPKKAKAFYLTIVGATFVGTLITFSPLDPVKALFWSAVINGVVAVPVMVMMMLMVSNKNIMGGFIITGLLRFIGWAATVVMGIAAAVMGITSVI